MKGRTYKRCTCTDPNTGNELGLKCTRLKRRNGAWSSDHGTWFFQAELPRRDTGERRPRRRGGFLSQTDAQAELDNIAELVDIGEAHGTDALIWVGDRIERSLSGKEPLPKPDDLRAQLDVGVDLDSIPTVGEWLYSWLAGRKKLRKSTKISYERHLRLWLVPHLGHHRLDELDIDHIVAMFDAMAERNDAIEAARASTDPKVQASVRNTRPMSAATMHRYRATLRAALNDAIRARKISFNPASFVELPSGKRPKALLWTPERVRRWQETGQKPSRVMVWTPAQTGQFLDQAYGDPLYALFHFMAYRGPRRGEACALPWSETDLAGQSVTITSSLVQLGWEVEFAEPKSDASGRVIPLDSGTTAVLEEQRLYQERQRLALGVHWTDSGLVFTNPDGTFLHPAYVSDVFCAIAAAAGLPPVRLHDLRHGAAMIMLAAGADLKVVQDLLGHSSITITGDTYAHVLPELARDSAEAAAAIVPRLTRPISSAA